MNPGYTVWLTISGAVAMLVAWLSWRRRAAAGAPALTVLMLSLAVWSLTYAVFWISDTAPLHVFWLHMTYFGVAVAPAAFLVFVLFFIGHGEWLKPRMYFLLSIVPIVTLVFLWTDPLHGLFLGTAHDSNASVILNGGSWFWVFVFYSYVLLGVGVYLLLRAYMNSPLFYRRQMRIMLVAAVLPWLVNLFMLIGLNPLTGLDLTPIAFTGTGLLFAYGIWGYRMMDLVPVARDVLVENMEDAIVVLDMQNRIVDINPKAMQYADAGVDSPFGKLIGGVFSRWTHILPQFALLEGTTVVQLDRPPMSTIELKVVLLKDRQGHAVGKLAIWRDITASQQTEERLRVFFYAVEQNPSAVLITDPAGRIEYVNSKFTDLTGYVLDEVRGKTLRVLKSGETPDKVYETLWDTIKKGETWDADLLNRKKNGELYWTHELIAPVVDGDGKVSHFIAMQQDITDRKHTESELLVANTRLQMQLAEIERLHNQLREESIRDGLTRLFNRRYMEETLDREISRADRGTVVISVVMMDVDLFKSINDRYGHQAGDAVLQTLGALLLENTRISDIACRYGGDEMLVVMPGASQTDAIRRAEEWRAAFSLMEFAFGDRLVRTSLSLGVASFPDHARTPNDLLLAADKALYCAKTNRNCVVLYDPAVMADSSHRSDEIR